MKTDLTRLLFVLTLCLGAFLGEARFTIVRVLVLLVCAGASLCFFKSARLARFAALVPAAYLTVDAFLYALDPTPSSPLFALALLCAVALATFALIAPLVRRSRAARVAARILILVASFALCAMAGEIVARRARPWVGHGLLLAEGSAAARPFKPDPLLVETFEPHFRGRFANPEHNDVPFETNADGFRDVEWPEPMPAGEIRILALGDSMTAGWGVEGREAWPAVLQDLLRARRPHSVLRVLNAGVAGYGTRQERFLLERIFERTAPTHVVLAFYDGNDLGECRLQFERSRTAGLHDQRLQSEGDAGDVSNPALGGEHASAPRRAPTLFESAAWYRDSDLYQRIEDSLLRGLLHLHLAPRLNTYSFDTLRRMRRESDPWIREEINLARDAVLEMARFCRERGAMFVLMRLPERAQAEVSSYAKLLDSMGQDAALYDRTLPGRALMESCQAEGVEGLDLLPALTTEAEHASPYFFFEGHTNRLGHRAIALDLAKFLGTQTSLGTVPPAVDERQR